MAKDDGKTIEPSKRYRVACAVKKPDGQNSFSHIADQRHGGARFADAQNVVESRVAGPHAANVNSRACHCQHGEGNGAENEGDHNGDEYGGYGVQGWHWSGSLTRANTQLKIMDYKLKPGTQAWWRFKCP